MQSNFGGSNRELEILQKDENSLRMIHSPGPASRNREGQNNTWDGNLSYDALFGSHYDSAKDEDYSENEDLLLNM